MNAETGKQNFEKVDRTPLDKLIEDYCTGNSTLLYKFEFPATDCIVVFEYLQKMGYEASRLFPGYGGIVQCIEERSIVNQLKKQKSI